MSNISKKPKKYYKGDAWNIVEEGFEPAKQRLSESIFSISNEYMGVRGYFEEGYSGDHLLGSYFNHLYEYLEIGYPQVFKGFVEKETGMVNAVDWLYTRISIDGEQLDLARSKFSDFNRCLDMKKGIMERSFTWETREGKRLKIKFSRFTNLNFTKTAGQKIELKPLNFSGNVQLTMGLDFNTIYEIASGWDQTKSSGTNVDMEHKNFWEEQKKEVFNGLFMLQSKTLTTDHQLFSSFRIESTKDMELKTIDRNKFIGFETTVDLKESEIFEVKKIVLNHWDKASDPDPVWKKGKSLVEKNNASYEKLLEDHAVFLDKAWNTMKLDIDGDSTVLQGIRFSTFANYQTYHCESPHLNALCKGLTGEVYAGWVWWDSETFVMRFHLFTNPSEVKNMLLYRYYKLPQAMERAKELGCEGARYPFASITGKEDCGTWQHVDLEIHINGAVFYAIWQYLKTTRDYAFLYQEGIEMLVQINRFHASWGGFSPKTGEFGLFGVMGPDEFHMMVDNNFYTNLMAKKSFGYTIEVLEEMKEKVPDKYDALIEKTGLTGEEVTKWKDMAAKMKLPRDEKTGIFEQHDGYFNLPHVDLKTFPEDQIPLYKNWPYIKIFRHNIIKQPDALLPFYFFGQEYSKEEKLVNYDFYEARNLHESSLSPAVHAVLGTELGKLEDGYEFTYYSARLDLDNFNNNTEQGLHVSASAGAWAALVHGWGGMRIDADILQFNPTIWKDWNSYSFRVDYRGALIELRVDKENAHFILVDGNDVDLAIYDKEYTLSKEGIRVELEEYWK
jgi:maltose phosphorylase